MMNHTDTDKYYYVTVWKHKSYRASHGRYSMTCIWLYSKREIIFAKTKKKRYTKNMKKNIFILIVCLCTLSSCSNEKNAYISGES